MEQRFSDRLGITKPPVPQVASMDDALRHSLWNILLVMFDPEPGHPNTARWPGVARSLGVSFFNVAADAIPLHWIDSRRWVKERYYRLEWFEVYNFIEHLAPQVYSLSGARLDQDDYIPPINDVLERENAGYRFVAGNLVEITNSAEIQAIEEARAKASASGLDVVRVHIDAALQALAQKPNSDPRNAVGPTTRLRRISSGEGLSGLRECGGHGWRESGRRGHPA